MKFVAVTQRVDVIADRGERRDCLDQQMVRFLLDAGFLAVPVPNSMVVSESEPSGSLQDWISGLNPTGIVLSGGNDLGSIPERDHTESQLLQWASEEKVPVLGICRGMQMMGAWAGGSLKSVVGHVRTQHDLQGEISGLANSFHNYAFADCPPGFSVLSRSEDNEIEAIWHENLPWEGWMWHPERVEIFMERDIQRLSELFV